MAAQFCNQRLEGLPQLVQHHRTFTLTLCVLNLIFSPVAILGNLLVIRALWKSSSIPANLKKCFLSLAFSDIAVGLFAQLMYGAIMAMMLKMAADGSYNFDFLCPTVLTVCYSSMFFLGCVSFLCITAIAVDRLLAVSLHLRYQELVTSRRVIIALVSLWVISGIATSALISLPKHFAVFAVVLDCIGLLLTTVAYIRIYKVVRYHQNQIQIQGQLQQPTDNRAMELLRETKAAFNALFVYAVFIACYVPYFIVLILYGAANSRTSFLAPVHVMVLLVLLNSSVNPLVYCWRYREIREIVKSTVKKMFCTTET